jgi:hypothetical protein
MSSDLGRVRVALLVLSLVGGAVRGDEPGYVLIIGTASGKPVKLSRADLKACLTGAKKQWDDGNVIHLVLPEQDTPALEKLSTDLFGVSAAMLRRKLKQRVFDGELRRPASVTDEAAAVENVKANLGSLAVVSAAAAAKASEHVSLVQLE